MSFGRNRARWEQKDAKEREVLKERFDQLKQLSPEERAALEDLARKLKDKKRKVREGLPEDVRRRLADLPPREREGVFEDHFRDSLRKKGAGIRPLLPEEAVSEFEREKPSRRALKLGHILRDHRPITPKDLKLLGKKLGVDSGVLEGLDALPPAALEERALAWKREYVDLCIEKQGLPPGLNQEEYENLRSTPHVEFFRRCGII